MRAVAIIGLLVAIGVLIPGARAVPPLRKAFPKITTEPANPDWKAKAHYWHARYAKAHRLLVVSERRSYGRLQTLLHRPDIEETIDMVCAMFQSIARTTGYGRVVDCAMLKRKASCESTGGNGYNPRAKNPKSTASGLFQFLLSTWRGTPLARFSPFNFVASALNGAWMHWKGRGGEWACR